MWVEGRLTRKEESQSVELQEARTLLQHRDRELGELGARAEDLQHDRQELATRLDRMVHGFTWRLRTAVLRIVGAPLALFRRARRSSGV
jgi:hypothetical protein